MKIFISYRRDDSSEIAQIINDELGNKYGKENVFFDIDNIATLGEDFRKGIERCLKACDVLLAIIGEDWLGQLDNNGNRRLDDPGDLVRIEIETALERNIPVVPVLVNDAKMPERDQLPEPLRDLVFRQAGEVRVRSGRDRNIERFLKRIEDLEQKLVERKVAKIQLRIGLIGGFLAYLALLLHAIFVEYSLIFIVFAPLWPGILIAMAFFHMSNSPLLERVVFWTPKIRNKIMGIGVGVLRLGLAILCILVGLWLLGEPDISSNSERRVNAFISLYLVLPLGFLLGGVLGRLLIRF